MRSRLSNVLGSKGIIAAIVLGVLALGTTLAWAIPSQQQTQSMYGELTTLESEIVSLQNEVSSLKVQLTEMQNNIIDAVKDVTAEQIHEHEMTTHGSHDMSSHEGHDHDHSQHEHSVGHSMEHEMIEDHSMHDHTHN